MVIVDLDTHVAMKTNLVQFRCGAAAVIPTEKIESEVGTAEGEYRGPCDTVMEYDPDIDRLRCPRGHDMQTVPRWVQVGIA